MAKSKEDPRPLQAIPAEGQEVQPGGYSGFQPSDKFADQGSTSEETDVTKHQRS